MYFTCPIDCNFCLHLLIISNWANSCNSHSHRMVFGNRLTTGTTMLCGKLKMFYRRGINSIPMCFINNHGIFSLFIPFSLTNYRPIWSVLKEECATSHTLHGNFSISAYFGCADRNWTAVSIHYFVQLNMPDDCQLLHCRLYSRM